VKRQVTPWTNIHGGTEASKTSNISFGWEFLFVYFAALYRMQDL
jgi:hypothetical protein